MGQLEKYGLYVLCLVIFLIFGVAIWGEPVAASGARSAQDVVYAPENGASRRGDDRGQRGSEAREQGGGRGQAQARNQGAAVDDLSSLLAAVKAPPRPDLEVRREIGGDDVVQPVLDDVTSPPPSVEPTPVAQRAAYQVAGGDTLGEIAMKQLGSTRYLPLIEKLNPGLRPERLKVGQKLTLPTKAEVAEYQASLGSSTVQKNGDAGGDQGKLGSATAVAGVRQYSIQRGDTLEALAKRHLGGASRTAEIKQLNPGIDPTRLRIGQVVYIPAR